jgi:hypothetical protein
MATAFMNSGREPFMDTTGKPLDCPRCRRGLANDFTKSAVVCSACGFWVSHMILRDFLGRHNWVTTRDELLAFFYDRARNRPYEVKVATSVEELL